MSRIGVVVLTHNRRADVTRTLERMLVVPDDAHVVVVDNGSTDGTAPALRRRFPGLTVIRLSRNRGAAGRNAAVAQLDCEYVAFCDDDTWWAAGSLTRAADLLDAHPSLGLVTGRVLVGPEAREDPTCTRMAASPLPAVPGLPGRPVLGFLAAASMVRRAAFLDAGGFEPRFFIGGEEELLALDLAAAGWAMAYVPDVVVHHHPSRRRDARRRRRLLVRNALWCAWLRLPLADALRRTAHVLAAARSDPDALRGSMDALGGLGWVLRQRRVVPHDVGQALQRLHAPAQAIP